MKNVFLLLWLLPIVAHSQLLNAGTDSLDRHFLENQKYTLPVFNGRLYYGYPLTMGDPFFPSPEWHKGSVLFEGMWYHDVLLMYDSYTDDVVIQTPDSIPVLLFAGSIQTFRLNSLFFTRLPTEENKVLKQGFYQRVVSGKINLFIKQKKIIEENIGDRRVERKFVAVPGFYIEKSGSYYFINSKNSLLSLLKDQRQAINRHLKNLQAQGIRFKHNKEMVITEISKLYNQLSP